MMIINIMKLKKQSSGDQEESNGRFLVRHSSSSVLNIFGCCSSTSANDLQYSHAEKAQQQKISIKNVIKKSTIFGINGNTSINESRFLPGDRRQQNLESSTMFLNRRKSQLSESLIHQHSERTIPNKKSQKISFAYNKQQKDNSVHNYHTTNYIVEKYIVKPQQMNIFIKPDQQKEENIKQGQNCDFQSIPRYQQNQAQDVDRSWRDQQRDYMGPPSRLEQQTTPSNCHFSFGQHQKNFFMNKFSGFRQVCSNRPSKQSVKAEIGQKMPIESSNYRPEPPSFLNFNKKQTLCNLVRDVHVMDQQLDDSSSGKSEVIDSYQNIMSRIQQKSRIIDLGSHE